MAEFSELPLSYRLRMLAYRWRRLDPSPWTAFAPPLRDARIALVTSAGLYRPGVDSDFGEKEGQDITVRLLPADVELSSLAIGQTSDAFDRAAVERDRNLALPLDRLHALERDGVIGSVAPRHVSFNGSMLAPGRFLRDSAPEVVDCFRVDQVDAVLFVPV
jgi:D-proline reductase (dithiol) PrdB